MCGRELRVSAILDIHDLKAHERHTFVKKFSDALMQSPREHWNPALLVLDEAHLFAPEQSKAESTASVIGSRVRLHLFIEHIPRSSGSRIPFTRSLAASLKLWHAKNTAVNRESVSWTRQAANVRFH